MQSYQNSNDILYRHRKTNPKIHMETQKTSNCQSNSEQNVQRWRYPVFKLYYRAITIKQHGIGKKKKRYKDQWIRIGAPEISPGSYSKPIFNTRSQNT
jgi:hypothetical protein